MKCNDFFLTQDSVLHQNTIEECMWNCTKKHVEETCQAVSLIKAAGLHSWKDSSIAVQTNVSENNPVMEVNDD